MTKPRHSTAKTHTFSQTTLQSAATATATTDAATTAAADVDADSAIKTSRNTDNICTATQSSMDAMTAWNILTCNEAINLVNWRVQGAGNDLYWPPNQPRGYTRESIITGSLAYCAYLDAEGLYGVPTKRDDWSKWLSTAYGGARALSYHSNIVYSNGNLDPWQPAGVPLTSPTGGVSGGLSGGGGVTQRLHAEYDGVVSLIIDMGGHHLDLFFEDKNDPQSVRTVREIEEEHIKRWIQTAPKSNYVQDL